MTDDNLTVTKGQSLMDAVVSLLNSQNMPPHTLLSLLSLISLVGILNYLHFDTTLSAAPVSLSAPAQKNPFGDNNLLNTLMSLLGSQGSGKINPNILPMLMNLLNTKLGETAKPKADNGGEAKND